MKKLLTLCTLSVVTLIVAAPLVAATNTSWVTHFAHTGGSKQQLNAFEALIKDKKNPYVVVKGSADWCGPCKQVKPGFEKMAKEFQGKVLFISVDVDKFQSIANKYGIRGIPAFLIFSNGKLYQKMAGSPKLKKIPGILNALMKKKA